jgi:hypothetical protein
MTAPLRLFPLYTTLGDLGGFLLYPYIFNPQGEWIGWVTPEKQVYSVWGEYVGWLNQDFRILRRRSYDHDQPKRNPPPKPGRVTLPAHTPLPPMMAELKYDIMDVLEERPELMPTPDAYAFDDEG